ncbi:MAG: cytochrome c oxidase subunit II [Dehalococcoidia bacterium]
MGSSNRRGRIVAIIGSLLIVGVVTALTYVWFADSLDGVKYPMTQWAPLGDNAAAIHDVYILIFILAGIVFVGIMALTLIFSLVYRERPGQVARQFHGNSRLEVLWTLIPVLIVVVMAVPTFSTIAETHAPAPEGALEVRAIGHQWWFEFEYPELGITTANELHIPVDRAVNVTLESEDVIHSFWVPRLAGKVDMVPGRVNRLWFTPFEASDEPYLGQCAEFCGMAHANMRFRVFVETQDDFDAWVTAASADRPEPESDVMVAGEQQFLQSGCVGCHTVRGNSVAQGDVGPDLSNIGSRTTIAAGMLDNTPENMRRWLSDPPEVKPGSLMPDLELSDEAIDRLVAYLEGLE